MVIWVVYLIIIMCWFDAHTLYFASTLMVMRVVYLMIIMCWFDAHTLFCFNPNDYKGCLFYDYEPYKHTFVFHWWCVLSLYLYTICPC